MLNFKCDLQGFKIGAICSISDFVYNNSKEVFISCAEIFQFKAAAAKRGQNLF